VEHYYYYFDVFNTTIDFQLQQFDCKFGERAMDINHLILMIYAIL
jgi:hypothetical protein